MSNIKLEIVWKIDSYDNDLSQLPKHLPCHRVLGLLLNTRLFLPSVELDNKLENYLGNTLDKHTKRIYRTPEGMLAYIISRKNGWIENRNQDLTN